MKLSILIAVYNAENCLPYLIEKLLYQINNDYNVEIILSIDDNKNYKQNLPNDSRIVYAESGFNSGPGNARTRALDKSTGTHITLLDSDDDISDNYISEIFKNLKTEKAFALKSVYKKNGKIIRKLENSIIDIENLSSFYGSIHTVAPKNWTKKYLNIVAEDVVATINVLDLNSNYLKIIDAEYIINIHEDSYCSKNGFKFTRMYDECLKNISQIVKEIDNKNIFLKLKKMYNDRLEMSSLFDSELKNNANIDYHEFILKKSKKTSNLYGRWY